MNTSPLRPLDRVGGSGIGVDPHLPRGRGDLRLAYRCSPGGRHSVEDVAPRGEGVRPRLSRSACRTSTPDTTSPRCCVTATRRWNSTRDPQGRLRAGLHRPRPAPRECLLTAPVTGLQTVPLLDAIQAGKHDAVFGAGGATRSGRGPRSGSSACATSSASGSRAISGPSSGRSTTAATCPASTSHLPLSNWTELDVWDYIQAEKIESPSIYYAHEREVALRYGMWIAITSDPATAP